MRTTLISIFLALAIYGSCQPGIVTNPHTRQPDFIWNPLRSADTLIYIGYGGSVWDETLNIYIGYSNIMDQYSISFGRHNIIGCLHNYVIGNNLRCDSDKTITIGIGGKMRVSAYMPGSIGFGVNTDYSTLSIHSGYPSAENIYQGKNIGGAVIGKGSSYNDDTTALIIRSFRDTATYVDDATGTQFIATEDDSWTVDLEGMELSGSLDVGNLSCVFVPQVYSGAADTSLLPTPLKIGDYYIDTSDRDVYISTGIIRGSWKKVN